MSPLPVSASVSLPAASTARLGRAAMIAAGVRYHWRTSLAVASGVAIATAVIVGALLVGDSMRGSLYGLTIERLGSIDSVVAPGGFFSADQAAQTLGVDPAQLATVMLFDRAVIETIGAADSRRAGAVQVVGCDESFWRFDVSGVTPKTMPGDDSIVLTAALAAELAVVIGDQVTVRLPVEQAVPADSPLGRRDVQTEGIPRLTIVDILPDRGLARFSLAATQATPKNVFLSRQVVADVLERVGQANIALSSVAIDPAKVQVGLADLGLKVARVTKSFGSETIFDYYSVTSDRLMIDDNITQAIIDSLPAGSVTPVMTYLANAIEHVDDQEPVLGTEILRTVTYSTISAMDSSPPLALNFASAVDRGDNVPMVLNSWAADRLGVQPGMQLRVAYYEPEVENGKEIERWFSAVVTDVVPITEPAERYQRNRAAVFDQAPTAYNDPDLTPTVPGVTDQDSMSDWDTPFELTREVPDEDDLYWKNHRLTPKAFIPLAAGRQLFASRFGQTTGLRIDPSAAGDLDSLTQKLTTAIAPKLSELGWTARSIRASQLAASKGTTPFDGLFLALSCFVIFSAVMLIAMLFRLGLVARSRELGTLMAIGLKRQQVSHLLMGEGFLIAVSGVLLGIAAGVSYAVVVLAALRTFWVGAVTVPFLTFHWTWPSLVGGGLIGLLIGMMALGWTLRSMLKNQAVTLLRGRDTSDQVQTHEQVSPWPRRFAILLLVLAIATGAGAAVSGGQTAAGGFVGGGMLLLIAMLMFVHQRLSQRHGRSSHPAAYSLGQLSRSNANRAPLRSTLTIGLMATASFLIVAITAFRLQPSDEGTGGFDLVAETAQPIYEDLADAEIQSALLGTDAPLLAPTTIVSLRVRSGQDASCNNLYQATEPTVLGVPDRSAELLNKFRFYAAAKTDSDQTSAWSLLARQASGTESDPIPMIVDQNTAMWSLQMIKGIGERKSFVYENQTRTFEVVGLLENSLLQGRLIIGETNFEKTFPEINGYRFALIDDNGQPSDKVANVLETRLGDLGFDASDARQVLSGMMAVQNTYLRTFQSLGGLGLLLGTVGLAIAQLRNVLERRSELAVMRAIGFTQRRLAALVMGETASLLLIGIGCGVLCAVIAVLPHAIIQGMRPPIIEPVLLVLAIVVFGLGAGFLAALKVVRMQLLDALRGS